VRTKSIFLDFVRTYFMVWASEDKVNFSRFCADVFYGRPLRFRVQSQISQMWQVAIKQSFC